MSSYEEEMKEAQNTEVFKEDRLKIPMLKYFWQASPLSHSKNNSIHTFLREIKVLERFTDYELRIFSQFLHRRNFCSGETIFREGDSGFGFYIIFSGVVDIFARKQAEVIKADESEKYYINVAKLTKHDYFGELSLLEANGVRNATAVAKEKLVLLAFFKPDLDELIERHPVVAAKFLQAVAIIVAGRFQSVTAELKMLKEQLENREKHGNSD